MPNLASRFATAVDNALDLAVAGEQARVLLSNRGIGAQPLSVSKLEMLYEMAYLRIFIHWEIFLEETFLRYACGYASASGTATMLSGVFYPSLAVAQAAVYRGNAYILWHNPSTIITRVKRDLYNGLHEQVISSNQYRLEHFAHIRHRIAHGQEDARRKFDLATMSLSARRYPGARPGRFLRDWDIQTTPQRWLDVIAAELKSLSVQITP